MIIRKKIKIKDMTEKEFKAWQEDNCAYGAHSYKRSCGCCPFRGANCGRHYPENAWYNNKDLYSDEFLDIVCDVDIETALTVEEEYLLKFLKNSLGIKKIVKEIGDCEEFIFTNKDDYGETLEYIQERFSDLCEKFLKKIELGKKEKTIDKLLNE